MLFECVCFSFCFPCSLHLPTMSFTDAYKAIALVTLPYTPRLLSCREGRRKLLVEHLLLLNDYCSPQVCTTMMSIVGSFPCLSVFLEASQTKSFPEVMKPLVFTPSKVLYCSASAHLVFTQCGRLSNPSRMCSLSPTTLQM